LFEFVVLGERGEGAVDENKKNGEEGLSWDEQKKKEK